MEDFINKWQTLIGSALGFCLAIVLSEIVFFVKSLIESRKERKEFLRRIEIGITRSLEDTFKTRLKLKDFVLRLRDLITEIKSIKSTHHFSLESINYPPIREIFRDIDAPNFKLKSYYLHNKLLWVDSGIKETNEIVVSLKNDFAELQRKNELNVILVRQNQTPDPTQQRMAYAYSLESFANAIDDFTEKFMSQVIEIMTQIKIYNEHLRKRYGFLFLWKQEGINFKYFQNKNDLKKFSRNLNSLDLIDRAIQKEVTAATKETAQRAAQLQEKI